VAGGDWYDDSGYRDAVKRADRAARWGWAVIAVVVALPLLAAVAVFILFLMVLFSYVYTAG